MKKENYMSNSGQWLNLVETLKKTCSEVSKVCHCISVHVASDNDLYCLVAVTNLILIECHMCITEESPYEKPYYILFLKCYRNFHCMVFQLIVLQNELYKFLFCLRIQNVFDRKENKLWLNQVFIDCFLNKLRSNRWIHYNEIFRLSQNFIPQTNTNIQRKQHIPKNLLLAVGLFPTNAIYRNEQNTSASLVCYFPSVVFHPWFSFSHQK